MHPPPTLQAHRPRENNRAAAPHFLSRLGVHPECVTTGEITAFARRSEMYRLVKMQFLT